MWFGSRRRGDPAPPDAVAPAASNPAPALAANHIGRNLILGAGVVTSGALAPGFVGLQIGDDCHIFDGCKFMIDLVSPESGIRLARNVAINFNCYFDGSGGIEIGEYSIFGPNVVVLSSSHRFDVPGRLIQHSGKVFARTVIGPDVWIGANAVIRAGVEIGRGSVIAAGAVVTRSVPPNSVAGGVPARVLRDRFEAAGTST